MIFEFSAKLSRYCQLWPNFFSGSFISHSLEKLPSKHLLTSSRRLQDMSWRCLQHILCVKIFVFQDVLKTSWKTKNCYGENVFKISSKNVLKTSSRRLGDKQNVYWVYMYLTNVNVYLTSLYFTNLYLTNLRRIQNALIRTQ